VTESLLLAMVAGLFGLLIGKWSVDALVALLPVRSAFRWHRSSDWRVLGYTLGVSVTAGLLLVCCRRFTTRAAQTACWIAKPARRRFACAALLVAQSALALR
jgi:hypothetical protein